MKKIDLFISGLLVITAFAIMGCGDETKVIETVCPVCETNITVEVPVDENITEEVVLPCPDTRLTYNPEYSIAECGENNFFWCSIEQKCLDKPINVDICGELGSPQREALNSQ